MCELCDLAVEVIARCDKEIVEASEYSRRRRAKTCKQKAELCLAIRQEQHEKDSLVSV